MEVAQCRRTSPPRFFVDHNTEIIAAKWEKGTVENLFRNFIVNLFEHFVELMRQMPCTTRAMFTKETQSEFY